MSKDKPLQLAVAGVAGRMGRRIVALAWADERFDVVAALEQSGHSTVGADAGELAGIGRKGLPVQDHTETPLDVLVDFSLPVGTEHWVDYCLVKRHAIVTGVTGLDAEQQAAVAQAARQIPIVQAANMSVGVNVLLRLVADAASVLDLDYDVEITETHHRFKADAPSGTANALLAAVCRGRDVAPEEVVVHGRCGKTGLRPVGQIGMHALRLGDTVGEHTVHFGSLGETITLGHTAHTRDTFVSGALRAAAWIVGRPAGLYSMGDVLFGS